MQYCLFQLRNFNRIILFDHVDYIIGHIYYNCEAVLRFDRKKLTDFSTLKDLEDK